MYGVVRSAGEYVMIQYCGDVDVLFDDLIEKERSYIFPGL